jgi:molecular chaperone DnaJ
MIIKDYYKILGLTPAATAEKIKATYRKLAFQYHPDKTFGDKNAEAKFQEVQEAYEILSNAARKINYDYEYNKQLQKHNGTVNHTKTTNGFAQPNMGRNNQNQPLRPQTFLRRIIEIRKAVESVKQKGKKINQEAVYNRLCELLSKNNIALLQGWSDAKINGQIIHHTLQCCRLLSYYYVELISIRLAKLAGTDNDTIEKVYSFTQQKKRWRSIENHKELITYSFLAILFVIILYLLISI